MQTLPTGTVTFLFTDVEGSTRLLQALGAERFRELLDRHDEILRDAIRECGGTEVRTEGDSFFAAFPTANEAIDAAVDVQRKLAAEPWPEDAPIRVRMGLHTGEGRLGGDDYTGIDVHRAARISAAGHGGQVLVSETTRALVGTSLPDGVSLRDLGSHRLKDIERPEHVHDLVIEGLASDFPMIRTADASPTNLPLERSSFIGRSQEISRIGELLKETRIVTLTGPGGTGKTRLAIHAGREQLPNFGDGVFFVVLSPVVDPGLVPSAIAGALGVREDPARPIVDSVADHLRQRELLLVLDNFEQILDAAPAVDRLVSEAPRVRVLVTSRAPLRIAGEHEYQVAPLELPRADATDMAQLAASEAISLFVDRTAAIRNDFRLSAENAPLVAGIVSRLDGLPLAIELAASRSRTLAPAELLERLDRRLPLLTGGGRNAPDRQRTLAGAIEWSYDLLDPGQQRLFARLSVFSGGWTLEAAEKVCGPGLDQDVLDGIESLIDQSLVRVDILSERTRYRMLQTIREFASDRLRESDEEQEIRRRHAWQLVAMARAAEPELLRKDRSWLDRLEQEHDNIRAALRWSIDSREAEPGLWLAGHLWRFWQVRSHIGEGQAWVAELLAAPASKERTAARAKALGAAGSLAYYHGDWERVRPAYEEAMSVSEEIDEPRCLAEATYNLSFAEILDRNTPRAKELLGRAADLYTGLGDPLAAAHANAGRAIVMAEEGDLDGAFRQLEGALETFLEARDLWGVAFASGQRAAYALLREDFRAAREAMLQSLEASDALEVWSWRSIAIQGFALTEILDGDAERGVRLAGAAENMVELGGGAEPPPSIIMMEPPLEAARKKLPQERIDELLEEGRAMDPDEAIALARGLG